MLESLDRLGAVGFVIPSRCDGCQNETHGKHLEGRLREVSWRGWLDYYGLKKSAEHGAFIFRFCGGGVSEKPGAKADKTRFWELTQDVLGMIDYDAHCTAERRKLFAPSPGDPGPPWNHG